MNSTEPRYAKKLIMEQWWMLKYKLREDNSIEILGHWAAQHDDPPPADPKDIPVMFRIEEDPSRFAGRVWLRAGNPGDPSYFDRVYVVANPQHVFSYKER